MLSLELIQAVMPNCHDPETWFEILDHVIHEYSIETPERIAAFLAQTSHESMDYNVLSENLNYSANGLLSTFPRYFNAQRANDYARKPILIANRVYANRMGNGDEASGEGWKYRGRGILQVTGKKNYAACSVFLFGHEDLLLDDPDHMLDPETAVRAACWYWIVNNLNDIADQGDMETLTRRINGGLNGLDDRLSRYNTALQYLKTQE